MRHLMQIEPVMVTNLIAAAIALLVAFNVPVSPDQRDAILQITAALIAIYFGQSMVARSRVYSPATVERMMAQVEE